ncbi:carbohydrate ABC transporter substrate-binding protein (CUT1 family) [Cohnella lupini]|uniref:Carbohydrate ABC transporter substrate-binding protein (CUT1 family) n=1 Tax=Cohnella lupini TaxID=1294267 RepID=A0A3D9I0T8_9BACL|nr:carbohydrate ABC transporter substrate-binding protein (CUT1 family) [Cohnella lupini]
MKKIAWALTSLVFLLAACSNSDNDAKPFTELSPAKQPTDSLPGGQLIETKSSDGPVKLTFATYFLSDKMKSAVKKYEELHPNVEIEQQATPSYGKDLKEAQNLRDKYVTVSNTAILAGKGPDLIELDILPMETYANRDLLVDLNEMIKESSSFRPQDYFANVLDNAKNGGSLYGMPLYFSLEGFIGDAAAISKAGVPINDSNWTWNDFVEVARQLQQEGEHQHALISEPSFMLTEMATENFSHLVKENNGKQTFDSDLFASLMNQVKGMFDDGLLFDMLKDGGGRGSTATSNTKAYFNEFPIDSFEIYLSDGFAEHTKLYTKPHPQDIGAGGYFNTFGTVGINANSPHKQEAWEFIQYLISDEAQSSAAASTDTRGFPINKIAYDSLVDKLKQAGTIQGIAVDNEKLDLLKDHLTKAVHWVRTPSKIDETIMKEAQAFFSGQKPATEVAKLVQSKVNLILNE